MARKRTTDLRGPCLSQRPQRVPRAGLTDQACHGRPQHLGHLQMRQQGGTVRERPQSIEPLARQARVLVSPKQTGQPCTRRAVGEPSKQGRVLRITW